MNWKKALVAVPMSLAILVPTAVSGSGVANAASNSQPSVKTPAANLRETLSELLATHFVYQEETSWAAYQNAKSGGKRGKDLEAAKEHLEQNAENLKAAVKSIYGQKAADAFGKIFSSQYDDSSGIGKALANGNQDKVQQIEHHLQVEFPQNLGGLLSQATGGNLPKDAAVSVLAQHEKNEQAILDDMIAGNYKQAYSEWDKGYKLMFTMGKAIASGIVKQMPDKFNNTWAVTPASNLRATLDQLLGAHYFYQFETSAGEYLSAKTDGEWGKFAGAAKEQLEQNAAEMKAAVKSIYGQKAADAFAKIFSSQYGDSAGLGTAMAKGNTDKVKQIEDHLTKTFPQNLGTLLSQATGGNLPKDVAIGALSKHEQNEIATLEAYVKPDYKTAYDDMTQGHKIMFTIGTALAGGIVKQMPDKFANSQPSGMPKTDLGGTAGDQGEMLAIILAVMAALTAAGAFVYRKKTAEEK